jgi:hypothetical protein
MLICERLCAITAHEQPVWEETPHRRRRCAKPGVHRRPPARMNEKASRRLARGVVRCVTPSVPAPLRPRRGPSPLDKTGGHLYEMRVVAFGPLVRYGPEKWNSKSKIRRGRDEQVPICSVIAYITSE